MNRFILGHVIALLFSTSLSYAMAGDDLDAQTAVKSQPVKRGYESEHLSSPKKKPCFKIRADFLSPSSRFCDELAEQLTFRGLQFVEKDLQEAEYCGENIYDDPRFIAQGGEGSVFKMVNERGVWAVKCAKSGAD